MYESSLFDERALLIAAPAGEIPKQLGALGKLEQLWLGDNELTGESSFVFVVVVGVVVVRELG